MHPEVCICFAVEPERRLPDSPKTPLPDVPESASSPRSGTASAIRVAVQQHVVDCTETAVGLTGSRSAPALLE